jgi:small subunit ribosomal protein S8
MTDPISDMIIRIKNASLRGKPSLVLPHSKFKAEIADILIKNGYLSNATMKGKRVKKYLELEISYKNGAPKLNEVKRVSKPSKRVYVASKEIRSVREGRGMAVISTPKGLLTDKEARKANLGGELLFQIW